MNFLYYLIYRATIFFFRIIPFSVLYIISGGLTTILFHVIGYRKKIIISNLTMCFPKKSKKEIYRIAQTFYRHLGDIILESVKGYTLDEKEVLERYKILNPEVLDSFFEQKKTIICLASHYGNWEWGMLSVALQLKYQLFALYKPLSNSYVNAHINGMRKRFKMNLVSIYDTRQSFESVKEKPSAYIMATDQNPSNKEKAIWVNFMDIETACLHGAEYYASKYNMPVVFFDVRKPKRGYYTLEIKIISDNPVTESKNAITIRYMNLLEGVIKERPEYWLWSHKRWKNKREKENITT